MPARSTPRTAATGQPRSSGNRNESTSVHVASFDCTTNVNYVGKASMDEMAVPWERDLQIFAYYYKFSIYSDAFYAGMGNHNVLIREFAVAMGCLGVRNLRISFLDACGAIVGGNSPGPGLAPQFASTPGNAASQGAGYTYQIVLTPTTSAATLKLVSAPSGTVLSGNTLTWTPSATQSRISNQFSISATNAAGNATQSWTVIPSGTVTVTWVDIDWTPDGTSMVPNESRWPKRWFLSRTARFYRCREPKIRTEHSAFPMFPAAITGWKLADSSTGRATIQQYVARCTSFSYVLLPGLFAAERSQFLRPWRQPPGRQRPSCKAWPTAIFILPYTIRITSPRTRSKRWTRHAPEFAAIPDEISKRVAKLVGIRGKRTVDSIHRELGKTMWENCGMSRSAESLQSALGKIPALREEFWKNVSIVGTGEELNQSLEKAGRVADFLEFAELTCGDALERNESCGGHFRVESQTPEGEALRNDEEFSYVAAWEWKGDGQWELHKEPLAFEHVHLAQRSYK